MRSLISPYLFLIDSQSRLSDIFFSLVRMRYVKEKLGFIGRPTKEQFSHLADIAKYLCKSPLEMHYTRRVVRNYSRKVVIVIYHHRRRVYLDHSRQLHLRGQPFCGEIIQI